MHSTQFHSALSAQKALHASEQMKWRRKPIQRNIERDKCVECNECFCATSEMSAIRRSPGDLRAVQSNADDSGRRTQQPDTKRHAIKMHKLNLSKDIVLGAVGMRPMHASPVQAARAYANSHHFYLFLFFVPFLFYVFIFSLM